MSRLTRTIQLTIILLCSCVTAIAQPIDHTSTFRHINQPAFFRFNYENDFFTGTDRYYSQGIALEYRHPGLQKFVLSRLLLTPASAPAQYGMALNTFGYTPTSTSSDSILTGDRPYDANMTLKLFAIQPDPEQQQQVSSSLSIGMMGPAALGREIQAGIHRLTKNPEPLGWQHQIKNDIILNYQFGYEKKLAGNNRNFLLNATGEARLGTLNTQLDAGLNFMAGRFNQRFTATPSSSKTEFYFFGQGRLRLVGYNASLQGGLFNRSSVYTIPASDISRTVVQTDAGLIINLRKCFFSYTQSFISKDFKTGKSHRWGGVSVGFQL